MVEKDTPPCTTCKASLLLRHCTLQSLIFFLTSCWSMCFMSYFLSIVLARPVRTGIITQNMTRWQVCAVRCVNLRAEFVTESQCSSECQVIHQSWKTRQPTYSRCTGVSLEKMHLAKHLNAVICRVVLRACGVFLAGEASWPPVKWIMQPALKRHPVWSACSSSCCSIPCTERQQVCVLEGCGGRRWVRHCRCLGTCTQACAREQLKLTPSLPAAWWVKTWFPPHFS